MFKNRIIIMTFLVMFLIINTVLVLTNNTLIVDNFIHDSILMLKSDNMDKFMHFITKFGTVKFVIFTTTLIMIFFLYKKDRYKAHILFLIVSISTILNNIIKIIIRRSRPEYITVVEKTFSYPSGHTMAATTLYGFLVFLIIKSDLSKRTKILLSIFFILLILLIAISRIYLGAHFFTDILGGMLFSTLLIIVFSCFYKVSTKS